MFTNEWPRPAATQGQCLIDDFIETLPFGLSRVPRANMYDVSAVWQPPYDDRMLHSLRSLRPLGWLSSPAIPSLARRSAHPPVAEIHMRF